MAHLVENMFSVVETPWHGLGVILDKPPTTEEAIVAAGLAWEVEKRPLFLADGRGVAAFATVRASDDRILGHHVGKAYTLLQNSQAFAWFDPFLASGEATLETAGSLREGSVVWALARLGRADSIIVPRSDDRVAKYLLLSNSHDGTTAVRVGFSPVRVVCANTLAMAVNGGESQLLRLKHTASLAGTLDMVRDTVNTANAKFEATAEGYRALASRQVNAKDLAKYVSQAFEAPIVTPRAPAAPLSWSDRLLPKAKEQKESRTEANARARQEAIEELFVHGRGNDLAGVKGTWWGAYNAVTEYLQHERPRSTGETRADSLAFGAAAVTSRKALGLALEAVAA